VNEIDVEMTNASREGHGYVGNDSLHRIAKQVLKSFHVFIDPRDEKEILTSIVLASNPNNEVLGFSQRCFVEEISVHVEKQFEDDNPLLIYDEAVHREAKKLQEFAIQTTRALPLRTKTSSM
jgi:hypothetical protein